MTMWDDPKKLIGFELIEVDGDEESGWMHLMFEKDGRRALYSVAPAAAQPVKLEPR